MHVRTHKKIGYPFKRISIGNGTNGLPTFYRIDQNYLITMMLISEYTVMDAGWNCFVHYNGDKDITGHRPVWDGRGSS